MKEKKSSPEHETVYLIQADKVEEKKQEEIYFYDNNKKRKEEIKFKEKIDFFFR